MFDDQFVPVDFAAAIDYGVGVVGAVDGVETPAAVDHVCVWAAAYDIVAGIGVHDVTARAGVDPVHAVSAEDQIVTRAGVDDVQSVGIGPIPHADHIIAIVCRRLGLRLCPDPGRSPVIVHPASTVIIAVPTTRAPQLSTML